MSESQVCKKCNLKLPLTDFYIYNRKSLSKRRICKICYNEVSKRYYIENKEKVLKASTLWKKNNKEKYKDYRRKQSYGMAYGEYNRIKKEQNNKCSICGLMPKDSLVIDHCHSENIIRGLLCRKCNAALGLFQDSIINLKKAIKYLRR